MDYLNQHVSASVPALMVISRYLATTTGGKEHYQLAKALHPRGLVDESRASRGNNNDPNVLLASLLVGEDLGLFAGQGRGATRVWRLNEEVRGDIVSLPPADSSRFRNLVLRRLGARALEDVRAGKRPSDVALALTWILLRDPLSPLSTVWDRGPENAFGSAAMRGSVSNKEQWLGFRRWMQALGLATLADTSGQQKMLLVDPTKAISATLGALPKRERAEQWFRKLHQTLPVLGHPELISALPEAIAPPQGITASVTLAMRKLERRGAVEFSPSADADDAAVLRLGGNSWRIAEVRVMEAGE